MRPIWQIFTREGLYEIAFETVRSSLWPPLLTMVATLIGLWEGIPLFYLFVGATLVFSAVASGLLRLSEWRYRQQVTDKLTFNVVRIGRKLNNLGCAESITLGFQLYNNALFPAEFELQSLDSTIDDKYPPKKQYVSKQIVIPSGGLGWFDDFAIELPEAIRDRSVEGMIAFVVRYGRLGHIKYDLGKKFQVFLGFDDKGDVKGANWNEVTMWKRVLGIH